MTKITNIATETIIYEKQAVMQAWGILFTTRLFKADRMINLRLYSWVGFLEVFPRSSTDMSMRLHVPTALSLVSEESVIFSSDFFLSLFIINLFPWNERDKSNYTYK